MITKEQALEKVKKYITERKREFYKISDLDKIRFGKNKIIYPYSKYYEQERDTYVVTHCSEGYYGDNIYFVVVDAETGEVLYTVTEHGYAEDWED